MTPSDYYYQQCQEGLIVEDTQQVKALTCLDNVYLALVREHYHRSGFYRRLRKPKKVTGAYLWGGVGIGKTHVMDCFYHQLPFPEKKRMHFHQFMKFIHEELSKYQGKKNPLTIIAKVLAKKAMVLCLDEMHVSDIADAMILARLLTAIELQGITLIMTSNVAPDDLYKHGLQRMLFLPVIAIIKKITSTMSMTTTIDYRSRHLKYAGAYYMPDDEIAEENMEKSFRLLSDGCEYSEEAIEVLGRSIVIRKQVGEVIWFNFDELCAIPRSQLDYLALSERYRTILISHVPQINPEDKNTVNLFIRMIDVFYDARIRLICSSSEEINTLYLGEHMHFEFKRTQSRLREMQSENYFNQI